MFEDFELFFFPICRSKICGFSCLDTEFSTLIRRDFIEFFDEFGQ